MGKVVSSSDALALRLWSDRVSGELPTKSVLLNSDTGLMGQDSAVQEFTDMEKGGTNLTVPYVFQTRSRGKVGVEPLLNDLNGLDTASYQIAMTSLRNGWSIDDQDTDQFLVSVKVMETMAKNAVDWAADRLEFSAMAHAAGLSYITDTAYTLGNTINAVDSAYIKRPNDVAAGSLTDAEVLDMNVIDDVNAIINGIEPQISPCETPWGECYPMLIHPDQHRSLKNANSQFYAAMIASLQGGNQKSGVWSNALGKVGNILLLESRYVPPGINAAGTGVQDHTRRAVVLGKGALAIAFGRHPGSGKYGLNKWQFIKEAFDFQQVRGFAARTYVGVTRPRVTDPRSSSVYEQGVLVVETYAPRNVSSTIAYRPVREAVAETGGLVLTT